MEAREIRGLKILSKTSDTSSEDGPPIQMLLKVKHIGFCCAFKCPNGFNYKRRHKLKEPPKDFVDQPGYHIMFPVPKNEARLEQWQSYIKKRHKLPVQFRSFDAICSTHFLPCDMYQKPYTSLVEKNGKQEIHTQYFTYLKPGTLPVYFRKIVPLKKVLLKDRKARSSMKSKINTINTGSTDDDDATYVVTPTGSPVSVTTLDAGSPIPLPQNEDDFFALDVITKSSTQLVEPTTTNDETATQSAPLEVSMSNAESPDVEEIFRFDTIPSTYTGTTDIAKESSVSDVCDSNNDVFMRIEEVETPPMFRSQTKFQKSSKNNIATNSQDSRKSFSSISSSCPNFLISKSQPENKNQEKTMKISESETNNQSLLTDVRISSSQQAENGNALNTENEILQLCSGESLNEVKSMTYSRMKCANSVPASLLTDVIMSNNEQGEERNASNTEDAIQFNTTSHSTVAPTNPIARVTKASSDSHLLFAKLLDKYEAVTLPSKQWASHRCVNNKFVAFSYIDIYPSGALSEKKIIFNGNMKPKIWFDGIYKDSFIFKEIKRFQDVARVIAMCDDMDPCPGTNNPSQPFSSECSIYKQIKSKRCPSCVYKRTTLYKRDKQRASHQKIVAAEIEADANKTSSTSKIAKQLDATKNNQQLLTAIMSAANEALLFQHQELLKVITPILNGNQVK